MVDIDAHRVESHDDGAGQAPLQENINRIGRCAVLLAQVPKSSHASLEERQQALQRKQHDEEVLEQYVVVADCLDVGVHYRVHDCVEHLSSEREDEEGGGAGLVPLFVHFSGVDGGSVAHEQKGAHESDDHYHLGMVLADIEGVVPADGLEVKVVGEPSHGCQDGSRDGGEAEEDELRVVLRAFADPAVREGRLVAVDLRDLVDDEERGDDDDRAELEEEGGREGALEHVDFYSIKMGFNHPNISTNGPTSNDDTTHMINRDD